jgi:hypothetical protein
MTGSEFKSEVSVREVDFATIVHSEIMHDGSKFSAWWWQIPVRDGGKSQCTMVANLVHGGSKSQCAMVANLVHGGPNSV